MYAITEKEAEKSPDVIVGKAHINGKLACILINHDATFSFLLSIFMIYDRLRMDDLNELVIVSMPIGVYVV